MEEAAIRQRLLTDEKLLKRIAKRYATLGMGAEGEISQMAVALYTELELFEMTFLKQERTLSIHDQEEQYYKNEQSRLETERLTLQNDIVCLKSVLEEEKRQRSNKDEYDMIAKEMLKYPNRTELQRSLAEVESEIESIASQQGEIQRFIEKDALAGFEVIRMAKEVKKEVESDLQSR